MTFHYIIVGAGSAGCVLANRLSANPATRVCLVEAGPPDRNPMIHMPFGLAALAQMRWLNWGYETAPEPGLMNRRLYWPRGRVLGGSSSINAMIYMRGHPQDYRDWAAVAGSDWDWPQVRQVFKQMEDNRGLNDDQHGQGGPLTVSDLVQPNPLSRAFVQAGVECQYPVNPDFNGTDQTGVGLYQVTQKDGQRFSAARAFLDPARDRPNLQFHFIPAYLHDHGRRLSLGYGLTLHVCDLLPKSQGRISLATPDPLAAPRIEANYLSHPDDLPVLLDGLKIARRILQAPALARHIARETLPGPSVTSDSQLEADIRARAETIYHPVGTCRMGSDDASVTDPQGRVRGVEGLRVVDASLMPQIIAGNTNAPTMMIAETIARRMLGRA